MSFLDDLLIKSRKYAIMKHGAQVDKAGAPYSCHLHYVATQVRHMGPEYEILAWLHDIVEDTDTSLYDLKIDMKVPNYLLHGVDCITKRTEEKDKENYHQYLDRVLDSKLSTVVKIADITHNCDMSRYPTIGIVEVERRLKYDNAIVYLIAKLSERS